MTLVQLAALYGKSPALESLGQDAKLELPKPVFALLGVQYLLDAAAACP